MVRRKLRVKIDYVILVTVCDRAAEKHGDDCQSTELPPVIKMKK